VNRRRREQIRRATLGIRPDLSIVFASAYATDLLENSVVNNEGNELER
jgi:hypothetical protein